MVVILMTFWVLIMEASDSGKKRREIDQKGNLSTAFSQGWFADVYTDGPGKAHLYQMKRTLFHGKTDFQDLFVFESSGHGKVAILDGFLRLTERHEFVCQEMLSHLALCSIPNPKKAYMRFFPVVATGYEDPRVQVHISDGVEIMKTVPQGTYDAIILDAFPNIGPTSKELSDTFLESVARAPRPSGVLSTPADSFWHKDFVHFADTIANCRKIFKGSVNYAWTTIPAYASGIIGFMLCASEGPPVNFKHPINPLNPENHGVARGPPKFYNAQMHNAAFQLPCFERKLCQFQKMR